MSEHPKLPPRLRWIFPRHPVFFVTFCTYRRRKLLASHRIHTPFVTFAIRAYSEYGIAVGRYVIMPDHLHLFVCGPDNFELGRWIGMLKQALARQTGQSSRNGDLGLYPVGAVCDIGHTSGNSWGAHRQRPRGGDLLPCFEVNIDTALREFARAAISG